MIFRHGPATAEVPSVRSYKGAVGQLQADLAASYARITDVDQLADGALVEAHLGEYFDQQAEQLRTVAAGDRRLAHTLDDPAYHAAVVRTIDQDVRSGIVVQDAMDKATRDELTPQDLRRAWGMPMSVTKRESLVSSVLAESVRSMVPDRANKPAATRALLHLSRAIDPQPTPERKIIDRNLEMLLRQADGELITTPEVEELERAGHALAGRTPSPRDTRTRQELAVIIQTWQEKLTTKTTASGDAAKLVLAHDLERQIASLDPDGTLLPRPQPPVTESQAPASTARKAAVATAATAAAVGMGSTLLPAAAAAVTPRQPASSVREVVILPAAQSSTVRAQTPTTEQAIMTPAVPAKATPDTATSSPSDGQTPGVEELPTAPAGTRPQAEPLPAAHPASPDTTVPVGATVIKPFRRVTLPSAHQKSSSPEPADTVVRISPPPASPHPPAGATQGSGETPQTPAPATVDMAVETDTADAPVIASTNEATSSATAADAYNQLLNDGASFTQRTAQLDTMLSQEGFTTTLYPNLQAAIAQQATAIETTAQATDGLTASQLLAYKQDIDEAWKLVTDPSALSGDNTASLMNSDSIYVDAVAQDRFNAMATYDPDGTNTALQAELQQFDPTTWGIVTELLASAQANILTGDQKVADLQTLGDQTAATNEQNALATAAAAPIVSTNNGGGSDNPPSPSKQPPAEHHKQPAPPKKPKHHRSNETSPGEHLSEHQKDVAAVKAMIQNNPAMAHAGRIMLGLLNNTDLSLAVISGVIGNPMQESGGAINWGDEQTTGGSAKGAFQWEGPRFDALVAFAHERGTAWTDPDTQIAFVLKEMHYETAGPDHIAELRQYLPNATENTTTIEALQMIDTMNVSDAKKVELAAAAFELTWERAGTPMMQHRINYGQTGFGAVLDAYHGLFHQSGSQHTGDTLSSSGDVSQITTNQLGFARWKSVVPQGAVGHQAFFIDQADLKTDNIDPGDACSLASTIGIYSSLTDQTPDQALIHKVHQGMLATDYSDSPTTGGLQDDGPRLYKYMNTGLGLQTHVILPEHSTNPIDSNIQQQIINALAQNQHGTPTMILAHTSSRVDGLIGDTPANQTSGHFMYIYAASKEGVYIANVGAYEDGSAQGKIWYWKDIQGWLDGFTVVSNPQPAAAA